MISSLCSCALIEFLPSALLNGVSFLIWIRFSASVWFEFICSFSTWLCFEVWALVTSWFTSRNRFFGGLRLFSFSKIWEEVYCSKITGSYDYLLSDTFDSLQSDLDFTCAWKLATFVSDCRAIIATFYYSDYGASADTSDASTSETRYLFWLSNKLTFWSLLYNIWSNLRFTFYEMSFESVQNDDVLNSVTRIMESASSSGLFGLNSSKFLNLTPIQLQRWSVRTLSSFMTKLSVSPI